MNRPWTDAWKSSGSLLAEASIELGAMEWTGMQLVSLYVDAGRIADALETLGAVKNTLAGLRFASEIADMEQRLRRIQARAGAGAAAPADSD